MLQAILASTNAKKERSLIALQDDTVLTLILSRLTTDS